MDGAVRVSVQGDAKVQVVYIDDGKDDVFIEGKVGAVLVSTDTPVTLRGADVKTVTATGENADITVDKNSKVETVASSSANTTVTVAGTVTTVAGTKEAGGLNVNVSAGGTATNVVTAAPNTTLANDGKVGQASFSADATDAKIVVGKDSTMEKVVNENKENLTTTTAEAEKAAKAEAAAKAAADKAAADKIAAEKAAANAKTEAEKAAAAAAQKAADEAAAKAAAEAKAAADAAAAAKAEADKVQEETNKKTEVKPVEPPKAEGGGTVTVPEQPVEPKPVDPPYNPPVDPYTHVTDAAGLTAALAGSATMIQIDGSITAPVEVTKAVTLRAGSSDVTLSGGLILTAPAEGTLTIDGFKITKSILVNANTNPGAVVLKNNDLTMADAAAYGTEGNIRYIVRFVTDSNVAFNITMDHNTVGASGAIQTAPAGTIAFLMNNKNTSNAPKEGSKFTFSNNKVFLSAQHTFYNVKAAPLAITGNEFVSGLKKVEGDIAGTTAVTAYNGGTNGTTTLEKNSFTGYGYGVKCTQYDADPAVSLPSSNSIVGNTTNTWNVYYAMTTEGLERGLVASVDALRVLGKNNTLTLTKNITIPEGKTLEIPKGKTLALGGKTLTNNGTILVNDEAGLRMATAVGGTVQLGKDITLAAGIDTSVNNLTLDGNGKTITFATGEAFTPVYDNRGMVFQGKGIAIKDLTIEGKEKATYPLAIHRFGDDKTVTATLTNVTVNGAGKTALDIACVSKLVLNNVKTTAPANGFGMVLDAVSDISGTGSSIESVSIHNKWGKITNVNLTDLGVTKVVVEDFSQTAPSGTKYSYDKPDTANEGTNHTDWAIFDKTDSTSKVFKGSTVTGLDGFTADNTTAVSQRAYKVTFTK